MKKQLLALLLCAALGAHAQDKEDKIETDRPNQTQTPQTVPRHAFQGELGLQFERSHEKLNTVYHPEALWKYGLFKKAELRLTTEWTTEEQIQGMEQVSVSGLRPVHVGTKIGLWEEKGALPQAALLARTTIPHFASKVYRENTWRPEFRLALQNSLSQDADLGYNLGAEWDEESGGPRWLYTLSPSFELGSHCKAFAEVFGFLEKDHAPEHTVDAGFLFLLSNNTQLDLAGGLGLTHSADHFVTLGFSFRFR